MDILHDFPVLDNKKAYTDTPEPFSWMCRALFSLGITPNYAGFFQTAYAASLCVLEPDLLRLVTKLLYPQTAKLYHTDWRAVERNIRTVINLAWTNEPALLDRLARRRLLSKPCNTQFLSILSQSFLYGDLPERL